MRMILGYIPTVIIAIPIMVLMIYMSFFSEGCMDGIQYVMPAIVGFVVGGLLNIAFLTHYWFHQKSWCLFSERWKVIVAKGSIVCAKATLFLQAICVLLTLAK